MATSPKKQDFGSPRQFWKSPTFSQRTLELMNAKLRIPEEAQPSKAICRFTVSRRMRSTIPASFLTLCVFTFHILRQKTHQQFSGFYSQKGLCCYQFGSAWADRVFHTFDWVQRPQFQTEDESGFHNNQRGLIVGFIVKDTHIQTSLIYKTKLLNNNSWLQCPSTHPKSTWKCMTMAQSGHPTFNHKFSLLCTA